MFHCNCLSFNFYVFNKNRSITLREKYNIKIPHLLDENKVPEVLLRRFFFESALKVYIESNVDVHS